MNLPKPEKRQSEPKRIRRSPLKYKYRRQPPKPRCKNCGHQYSQHSYGAAPSKPACLRCAACSGYEPTRRGSKASRRTPNAALRKTADELWTRVVHARPGGCEIQQYHPHTCVGGLQAMHGIPRTFSATRWLLIDGFLGCAGVHKRFTERPESWSALLLEAWGLETFRELWALARASKPVDMETTIVSLRAELARLGGG